MPFLDSRPEACGFNAGESAIAVKDHQEKVTAFQDQVQERLEAEIEYQPHQLNDLLLQVGKLVFDVQRPRVRRCLGTRAVLQVDGTSATFTLIKKWAPKQAKKRTQLRSPNGRLLCPAEEVRELAEFWKEICAGSDGQAPPSQQPRHPYHVSCEELVQALRSLKGNKAAPAHCAPHVMWQLAAEPIAEFLDTQFFSQWRNEGAEVFEDWSASWLSFLNKANKPGNKPGDLRPISLLEPAGKAVSGILKQHLMPYLQPWIEARHLFGYLPNRSPQQALNIVFQHCTEAIVVPTVMYSITASGVLPKGFDLLRVMLTKQARAIARSPRHRLGGESGEEVITESDDDFWRKVGIDSSEKLVQNRLKAAVDRTTELSFTLSPQDVRVCSIARGREQAMQQQFQDRCIQPMGAAAVHTCDICGAKFGDHSSLRAHKARLHSTERRQTAAPTFDRQRHGVDGMPTCSMCGHKFPRWADLQKHVTGNFCQKSASGTQVSAGVADVQAKISVWDQAQKGTLQLDEIRLDAITEGLRHELLQHCALCRQWLPDPKYVKIHWGRVHKQEWQAHDAPTLQWRRAAFARVIGTCDWCHRDVPKGSVHSDSCPVLFQLSMVRALVHATSGADAPAVSAGPVASVAGDRVVLAVGRQSQKTM
eukprot:s3791_g2.t1